VTNKFDRYNHSPKGKLRSARYRFTPASKARTIRFYLAHPNYHSAYKKRWREFANEVLGCEYGNNWGLYKLLKAIKEGNIQVVEVVA